MTRAERVQRAIAQLPDLADQGYCLAQAYKETGLCWETVKRHAPKEVFLRLKANGRRHQSKSTVSQWAARSAKERKEVCTKISETTSRAASLMSSSDKKRMYDKAAKSTVRWWSTCSPARRSRRLNAIASGSWRKTKTQEELADIKRRNRKGLRRYILNNPEAWRGGVKTWYHELSDGKRVMVQSGWEAETAELFVGFGIGVKRAPRVNLGSITWKPDFLVNLYGREVVVEVKGHPKAKERWVNIVLPAIHESAMEFPVLLVDFNPGFHSFDSLEDFMDKCTWVKNEAPPV